MRRDILLPSPTVSPPAPAGDLPFWLLLALVWTFIVLCVGSWLGAFSLSPATWYIARSSGLVLFGLSWVLMVSGLSTTTKMLDSVWGRHLQYSVHTYALQLWCGFLLLHVASLLVDPTVSLGPVSMVVPWTSGIREPWTGFGVLAAEIMIVIGGSAWLRRWLGYALWRALHWLSFPVFVLGLLHGLGSGSDAANGPVRVMYLLAASTALFMACYRVVRGRARHHDRLSRHPSTASVASRAGRYDQVADRLGSVERIRPDATAHSGR
jgi:predicted ferric reductase